MYTISVQFICKHLYLRPSGYYFQPGYTEAIGWYHFGLGWKISLPIGYTAMEKEHMFTLQVQLFKKTFIWNVPKD